MQGTCKLLVDSSLRPNRFDVRSVVGNQVSRMLEVGVGKRLIQEPEWAQSEQGAYADQEIETNVSVYRKPMGSRVVAHAGRNAETIHISIGQASDAAPQVGFEKFAGKGIAFSARRQ